MGGKTSQAVTVPPVLPSTPPTRMLPAVCDPDSPTSRGSGEGPEGLLLPSGTTCCCCCCCCSCGGGGCWRIRAASMASRPVPVPMSRMLQPGRTTCSNALHQSSSVGGAGRAALAGAVSRHAPTAAGTCGTLVAYHERTHCFFSSGFRGGHVHLLTSLDRGYLHQGCWGWGGNVADCSEDTGCSAKPRARKHSP